MYSRLKCVGMLRWDAMDRPFNHGDRQKRVVTADGKRVGNVRDVNNERATIEHSDDDDSLTEDVLEFLGWSNDDETHELQQDQVERYDDNELRLQSRR